MRLRVLRKTGAEMMTEKKFWKKSFKKVWKFENNAYLCSPVRKTGPRKRVNKFIEKTVLLYKKQVPRKTIYREALILLKNYKCQDKLRNIKIIQWRVWSWLRMNASGRLNTCKSRGSMGRRFVEVLMATGARVRNAWATCPFLGNNRWKRRLIPHSII